MAAWPLPPSGVVGVSVGAALLVLLLGAASWVCYRRRGAHKKLSERPLTLRRPTAVKNPAPQSHYLKKSPSPTGNKSPPGGKSPTGGKTPPGARTPTTSLPPPGCGALSPSCTTPRVSSPAHQSSRGVEADRVTYENEHDKPSTPSKEELELNERNLAKEAQPTRLGKLHFKLRYNFDKNALVVTIVRCSDLPAKDPALTSSDPYVKLQLLPEKQHKVKTRVLRKTVNPVYDEDFTFYGINYSQLQNITLHFVVLSFDRYSRDDIIGEVVSPLGQLDFTNTENCISLTREINPRSLKIRSQGRGELLVSLCHQPAANRLTVVVLKARNLPKMDITGLSGSPKWFYKWFSRVVLQSGSPKWFSQEVLQSGFISGSPEWFSKVVIQSGSPEWFSRVVLQSGSPKWFSKVVLQRVRFKRRYVGLTMRWRDICSSHGGWKERGDESNMELTALEG
ncbi:synaptotagmin-4-like [Penaeus chinensis]|uniref:synaptotagmin-4-like n=1 Tax=Penaeus chinensis TaxID=139456 RepID=UPI001FB65F17|nr:synaptotagmin-4-like [Penaeus chinensis]